MDNVIKMKAALKEIAEDYIVEIKAKISMEEPLTMKLLTENISKISGQLIRIDSIFMNSIISDRLDITTMLDYQSVKSVLQQRAADEVSLLRVAALQGKESEAEVLGYEQKMVEKGEEALKEYYNG